MRAKPAARLVQAGLGRAGRPADLPGGKVGVVVQLDGAPLAVRQIRDRGAQRLGAIQVIRGGQPLRRDRVQALGPLSQQHQRRLPGRRAMHVADNAAQPGAEPVRVPQPVQGDEGLQERLLHDVVHVIGMPAQPRRAGPRRRRVPLNQQPESGSVPGTGPPDQIAVADVHTNQCRPGVPRLPASTRPRRQRPSRRGLHPRLPGRRAAASARDAPSPGATPWRRPSPVSVRGRSIPAGEAVRLRWWCPNRGRCGRPCPGRGRAAGRGSSR